MRVSLTVKILTVITLLVVVMSIISIYSFNRANSEVAGVLQKNQRAYILSRIKEEKLSRIKEEIRYIKFYAVAVRGALAQSLFHLNREVLRGTLSYFAKIKSIKALYINDSIVGKPYLGIVKEQENNLFIEKNFQKFPGMDMLSYPLEVEGKVIGKMIVYYDIQEIIDTLDIQKEEDLKILAIQSSVIKKRLQGYLWKQIVIFLFSMMVLLFLIAYLLHRLVNRPLKTLQENIQGFFSFFNDAKKHFMPIALETKDEFGQMSHEINQNIESVLGMHREIEETQREILFTIGTIAEAHSQETGRHVQRVAEYSRILAHYYGLSEEEVDLMGHASAMHDIGKLAIPDSILQKPAKLSEEEFRSMQEHAVYGYDMLRHSQRPLLKAAATIAHEHHEKYDGSGYPRGIKGDNIHIYGRILALADVFDALGSNRVYKKAWEDERIFALLREERGKHFDPKLIDIFFDHMDDFLKIRERFSDRVA